MVFADSCTNSWFSTGQSRKQGRVKMFYWQTTIFASLKMRHCSVERSSLLRWPTLASRQTVSLLRMTAASRNHPVLFSRCFGYSGVLLFFFRITHLKTCFLNKSDCAMTYRYTHSQWWTVQGLTVSVCHVSVSVHFYMCFLCRTCV